MEDIDVSRLSASRKSLIATSVASFVLLADKSPGINWVVDISGAETWLFLLVAHSYFFAMFIANGAFLHLGDDIRAATVNIHGTRLRTLGHFRIWMERPFVTLVAILASGVIVYNLITAWNSTATRAIAPAF